MKRAKSHSRGSGHPSPRGGDVLRHLGDSLHAQWGRYRRRLKRCQEHFSNRAVHDSRVTTRRLLSSVELLGAFLPPGELRKARLALKQYLDTFDQLRDTQVQRAYVTRMADEHPAVPVFAYWLEKREVRFTRQTRKTIKRIKTKRLGRRLAALEQAIRARHRDTTRQGAHDSLLHAITLAFARTVRLQLQVNPEDLATIHRTRVAFKRFRYMIEALLPLLPAVNRKYRRSLRRYQSLTGDIQDLKMMVAALDEFTGRKKKGDVQAGGLRRELMRRQQRLICAYLNAADGLLDFWPLPKTTRSNPKTQ